MYQFKISKKEVRANSFHLAHFAQNLTFFRIFAYILQI